VLTLMYEPLPIWGTRSMFNSVNDPSHWLDRAEHMRELVEQSQDAEAKAAMLRVASEYEKLAGRAAARSEGRSPDLATASPQPSNGDATRRSDRRSPATNDAAGLAAPPIACCTEGGHPDTWGPWALA
jgi:hypothetical protein